MAPSHLLLVSVCALSLACGARYQRVALVDSEDLVVTLRSERRGGAPVPRGFRHPTTLSAARAASILGRIDVRERGRAGDQRRPAMPPQIADTLGAALADALARADSTQEVALRAQRRERRLGIFSRRYVTSLVAFVDSQNRLQLHLVDADRELPAGEEGPLPEPIAGRGGQAIEVVPGPYSESLGDRALAVDWRADLFRRPGGRNPAERRRTILMESTEPQRARAPTDDAPDSADPVVQRGLTELEAQRRSGALSEAEYQRQRAELLRSERN